MQRTKVGETFSTWRCILFGFPQGPILGLLLFNIYINDLFLSSPDFEIANYADDNSPYEFSGSTDDVIKKLEEDALYLLKWYENNYLVPNPDKWHLRLSETGDNLSIFIGNKFISNSNNEKFLGVYEESQKLHALARVSNFMSCKQRLIIMNAFIYSQFCYCPLIWMCHSRSNNNCINRIHARSLRIVYRDETSSFKVLLEKSRCVTVHHRNLQFLATEIYKAVNNLSSSLMFELFKIKEIKYNLRRENTLVVSNVRMTRYGLDSISYLGPKIWDLVPDEIKKCSTMIGFKQKIKTWVPA